MSSDEETEIDNFARKRSKNIDSDVSLDVSSKCFMIINYNLFCVYIYRRVMRIILFPLPSHFKKVKNKIKNSFITHVLYLELVLKCFFLYQSGTAQKTMCQTVINVIKKAVTP